METSAVQSAKLAIMSTMGLSKDALHIYVGLAVFLIAAAVLRKSLRSIAPWLVVAAIAVAGELFDMRDDIYSFGYWRWQELLYLVVPPHCLSLGRQVLWCFVWHQSRPTRRCMGSVADRLPVPR